MQDRIKQIQSKHQTVVHIRRKSYAIADAGVLAIKELNLGNFQAAVEIYNLILAKVPGSAAVHVNRGVALQAMKRYEDALASFDKAIAIKPDHAEAHNNRGAVLQKMNRFEEALASYDKAIALKPDYANPHQNRGSILKNLNRNDDALASFDRAIALKPDHAEAHNNRGLVLMNTGDMPEAEKMFLKALALKRDFPAPWFNLVSIRKYQSMDNADAKSIQALLGKAGISLEDKEQLHFSLGKIYDDCGLCDEAFECYRLANQIRNSMVCYDPDHVTRMTDDIINVFNKDFLAGPFEFGSDDRSPLFIVGMPRSGTTLLASMLSNHRSVATAGELPTIIDFTSRLPKLTGDEFPYPQVVKQMPPAVATRLANDYMQRLRRDFGANREFIIDKNPLNFRHLGFISRLFPKARIIHCTRHPMAVGLSNYFQRFPLHLDYAFDLKNIGHFYGEYSRLMEHWRKVLPLNMIEISYEDMVLETEKTARMILSVIGLEWDERCLTPHTNPCAVETASQWQVRQPIYRQSLERWRHYEKHLAPLKEMLPLAG